MEKRPRGLPLYVQVPLFSPSLSSSMAILVVLFSVFIVVPSVSSAGAPAKSDSFTPPDNYLLDCGSPQQTTLPDKRVFLSDQNSKEHINYEGKDLQVSVDKADVPLPIYRSAKVFSSEATYTFGMNKAGWHWIRLHFFPVPTNDANLQQSKFTVVSDSLVLLHEFSVGSGWVMKEYLVNVTNKQLSIKFTPVKDSTAFINAIEVVSAPDMLISDVGNSLVPVAQTSGLSQNSYQTIYRLNVGGPKIESQSDTLGRTWSEDIKYLKPENAGKNVSVEPKVIIYPDRNSPLIAPASVYASAMEMGDSNTVGPNFNVTWSLDVDTSFTYLVRLHFADIVSKSLNDLYFNVYVGGKKAISGLDLSTVAGDLASAYYKDFVVNSSMGVNSPLKVQIGPMNEAAGTKNALLNGLEVFKINNSVNSLDGEFGADGKTAGPSRGSVAAVGFAMMFGAFVGLGAMAVKWQKRPQDWQKSKSFSSWLLPIHAGDTSFMSSKTSLGSRKGAYSSTMGLGRFFSFAELQEATKNWDASAIVGVGGFGNVYLGEIDNGTKVAIKRGNPQSEQGINEFQTEIQMLSKLRHRHLVSLIGYCDENDEMILVYEYMSNGPLRDHLYGKNLPTLPWKQRLEICIGAARGLHYLHTGSAQGIIHRDVKTTNILLDDNFVAKMADFGLSKDGSNVEGQAYVSTAVKGSFGYLDPEYFRKQQLTDKSDVYSFGVVLLEVLCARAAINPALPREQVNLAEWALQWKRKDLLDKIMDPTLVEDINLESMKKFAEAAEKCLGEYGVDRPTMGDVLWNLEHALQLQEASLKAKSEEENNAVASGASPAVPSAPAATTSLDNRPVPSPQQTNKPAQVDPIDEHSGTAVFKQFAELNGR
ncbi:probable receptor-like protein kinase At4g39110 [Daucus carota subsp. sativus]|nr:PREDICTED: probable receptor-like protein kinase At4g39110 [Daucus carota subsp. sativus]